MRTRNTERKCAICGEDDPRALKERHHIYGRANDPDTILLCFNCHTKITQDQNLFPPKIRSRQASAGDKKNLEDVSIGSLLELLGRRLKKRGLGEHGNSR